jgi:nucleoside-diphosphate-sugar epimerase
MTDWLDVPPPPSLATGSSLFREDLEHVFAHTRRLWEEIRGRRLFITGGTGFFGRWLIESFLWANEHLELEAEVVVLSRDPRAFCRRMPHLAERPALSFHAGDVRTFAFPAGRFSHIIHAVNQTADDTAAPSGLLDVMSRGTQHTLEFARRCGAEKLLFTSSGSVYGPQAADVTHIPEDYIGRLDTMEIRSAHGHGKRFAEHLCAVHAEQYGIEAKIARGFALVGPGMPLDSSYAVGNFVRDGLRGGPIVIKGDGTPLRSYLYAADLAIWLWTILFRGRSCRPYNVGSANVVSIAEAAHLVAASFDPRPAVEIAKTPVPGRPAQRYLPDCRRARDELGLRERVGLSEGIRRTVRWHQARDCDEKSGAESSPLPMGEGQGEGSWQAPVAAGGCR